MYSLVSKYFQTEPIEESEEQAQLHPKHENEADFGPFFRVTGVNPEKKKVRSKANALLIKDQLKQAEIEKIRPAVLLYIPAALLPYIEIGQEKWGSELRFLSIMFVNIGIDLRDARSDEGLQRIHEIIFRI